MYYAGTGSEIIGSNLSEGKQTALVFTGRGYLFLLPIGERSKSPASGRKGIVYGKKVAFPRVEGSEMEFYEVTSLKDFQEGSFHVMEPVGGEPVAVQNALVLVPGLGFDSRGSRIGYGGGYYDRYFSRHPKHIKVGIAYAVQLVGELEVEEHDISMDGIVTEEGILGNIGV